MQSRPRFLLGISSLFALTSCSSGVTNQIPRITSIEDVNRHVATWNKLSVRHNEWHIAVTGYSPTDVLDGRVPAYFDFSAHRELPELPSQGQVRVPHYVPQTPQRPCATDVCISPLWYRDQSGATAIYRNSSGAYILPNGSTWTATDVQYSGPNNSGVLEGYTYYGSDGSQWFAGSGHAGFPETQYQFQMKQDDWYKNNTSPC